jgi:hypothetical protein
VGIALCNVGGTIYALDNCCPHAGGPLGGRDFLTATASNVPGTAGGTTSKRASGRKTPRSKWIATRCTSKATRFRSRFPEFNMSKVHQVCKVIKSTDLMT